MTITIGQIHQRDFEFGAPDAKRARHSWRVVTDNFFTRAQEIITYGLGTGDFPERFTPHPDDGTLTVRTLTATNQSDSPKHWIVEANYSSAPLTEKEKEKESQPNPLLRPVQVRMKSLRYREAIFRCKSRRVVDGSGSEVATLTGTTTANSAGDYIDPPVEMDRSYWQVTLTKNVADWPGWLLDIDNPVNDASVTIKTRTFAAGTLRVDDIDISELQSEGEYEYYVITIVLEYRKNGHKVLAQDQGFRKIKSGGGGLEEILDDKKQRISSPWPLDGAGNAIGSPTPELARFIEMEVCEEMDFSVLPLT